MAYQIFISYRREGSEFLGKIFYDRLREAGYTVFYDVEQLKSGVFNEQLYTHIDGCTDFILLLPPHALDRCISDPDDWVLREITRAIEKKKNIIPVVMRGFGDFPVNLPPAIASLPLYERLDASAQEYFDAAFDRLCTRLLHSVPMATADGPETQKSEYPVTAVPVLTDTVREMLLYTAQKRIPFELFMEFFSLAEGCAIGVYDLKESLPAVMRLSLISAEIEFEKLERGMSYREEVKEANIEKIRLLSEWLMKVPENKLSEITRFYMQVRAVRSICKRDGMTFRNPVRQHFTYESSAWDIMDVIETGNSKWIIATSAGTALLPETGVFSLEGGSMVRMAESSQEYLIILALYCVAFRLMDIMPEYVKEKLGPDNLRTLRNNLDSQMPGALSSGVLDHNVFNNNSIYGECVRKVWFSKVKCLVNIDQKYCFTIDPDTKQDNRLTQFGKEQALDIVRIRESTGAETDYLVLTCPQKSKGMQYYRDEPHVYRFHVSRNAGSSRPQLEYTELLPGKSTIVEPGVLERFSLRMALLRKMGIVG